MKKSPGCFRAGSPGCPIDSDVMKPRHMIVKSNMEVLNDVRPSQGKSSSPPTGQNVYIPKIWIQEEVELQCQTQCENNIPSLLLGRSVSQAQLAPHTYREE